jgi:RNA polymerase sigma factor (TIGR02999 family)
VKQAGDVTGLLQAWTRGDPDALAELASLVHYELRQMAKRMLAGERAAYAWQPTDLINESYLRLLGWRDVEWKNRAHFFAAAAKMMRRVLVDAARARQATKRGAGQAPIPIDGLDVAVAGPDATIDVIALESALAELAALDPRKWSKCVSSVDSASKRRLTRSASPRAP